MAKRKQEMLGAFKLDIPLSVPREAHEVYTNNYLTVTAHSKEQRLFLFAGDQKIEHLNQDFYGKGIAEESAYPEHLFAIASKARIGAFTSQLGLIARYGKKYKNIPFVVKLNSKTNLLPTDQEDPLSLALNTIEQVLQVKKNGSLNIVGVGYTLYPGSKHEAVMMQEASQMFYQAHQHGLITILWSYPRGKSVINDKAPAVVAGAAGIAPCLGADFVKINPPITKSAASYKEALRVAVAAAGGSGVVCSGGATQDAELFLETLHAQLSQDCKGAAIGRNIHQKSLPDALRFCEAIAALMYDNVTVAEAKKILKK